MIEDGWNGFNVLHTSASRMASLILGYAQPGGIADIEAAAPELVLLLGADEVAADRFKRRLQGLHRPPRRQWREAGGPGAAGRGLCRKARHLRQHRGPRAAWREGGLRSGRGARGLGDPARGLASLPARSCRSTASTSCARRWSRNIPQLGREGLIDLPWSPPKLAAKAEGPIRYPIGDFFLTNAICRNSPTMQRCSEELVIQGGGVTSVPARESRPRMTPLSQGSFS